MSTARTRRPGSWLTITVFLLAVPTALSGARRSNTTVQAAPQQQEVTRRLDAYVAPLRELQVFDGVVAVARDTAIVLQRAYGKANVEHGVALAPDHVFRIASVSKSFTRVMIGQLVERGAIRLDEPIARFLPRYPSADRITIRMLVDHRAGIPHVNSLAYDEEAVGPNTLDMLVDSLAHLPLTFAPGSATRYSNGGYALLAHIIQRIHRKPYAEVLASDVLAPLGLDRTSSEQDGDVVAGLADGYMPSPDTFGRLVRAPYQQMATKAGGGSLVSTARDLVIWASAIGSNPLLKAETWRELFPGTDSLLLLEGRSPGYNVVVMRDAASGLTAAVLSNNYQAGMVRDIARAAIALVAGRSPAPLAVRAPVQMDVQDLDKLAGPYLAPPGVLPSPPGMPVDIRRIGPSLVAHIAGTPVDVLVPQGDNTFLIRGLWSRVRFHGAGGDSATISSLYRDASFVARRVRQ